MSDHNNDLPRDLRGFLGGLVEYEDGAQRELFNQVQSYYNLWSARVEIERVMADPKTLFEEDENPHEELELVKRLLNELKERILSHYTPRPPKASGDPAKPRLHKVDHGAKSKVEKALSDIEAGNFDLGKKSKTMKAVLKAIAFSQKNGRMPSHDELMKFGFNNQQATDAGQWLAKHADPESDPESLFAPLHRPKKGRPQKK